MALRMGAWGYKTFENETALEWLDDLEAGGMDYVKESLTMTDKEREYIDADAAWSALAACEAIASLQGHFAEEIPNELAKWASAHKEFNATKWSEECRQVIDMVLGSRSELNELWREKEDDYPVWRETLADLKKRV